MALEDTVVELQKFFAEMAPRAPFSLPDPVPLAGCQPARRRMDDLTPELLALRREEPAAPEPPPKRKRRPSMADAARLAAKECVEVKIAPDGTITATPVKPLDITPTDTTETGNEWDRLQ